MLQVTLSYCNYCGAKLSGVKGDSIIKSPEVRPESVVWAMVAVLVFGFVAIVFLLMAMKMVGLNEGQILAFTILSFLIMLLGRRRVHFAVIASQAWS